MGFKERLRDKRIEAGMLQRDLAEKAGVTTRTIQNYELGTRRPQHTEVVQRLAEALGTTSDYLMGMEGQYIMAAQQQGGAKAARDIEDLVAEVSGLFAGGTLDDEAMEGAMRALNEAYWRAKEKNKKYTPKKYRKEETDDQA